MEMILSWVQAGSTPLLGLLCLVVWRIKTNDLYHIHDEIRNVGERISKLEGKLDA